jgi:hypothetical protein
LFRLVTEYSVLNVPTAIIISKTVKQWSCRPWDEQKIVFRPSISGNGSERASYSLQRTGGHCVCIVYIDCFNRAYSSRCNVLDSYSGCD